MNQRGPWDLPLAPGSLQRSGLRVLRVGKWLKSRLRIQRSVTPEARHSAAMRASWTSGPATFPSVSSARSVAQCVLPSPIGTSDGDSSQVLIWAQGGWA